MHLLIDCAQVATPALRAARAAAALPALRALLAGLQAGATEASDPSEPATPFELAHARALGLPAQAGHIPWAAFETGNCGTPCAWVHPCHWQVGADRILMDDPAALPLDEAGSRALLAALAPWFADDGITLSYARPDAWLARGEVFAALRCASLRRVTGRNVDAWLPPAASTEGATLRRLQNEMQMLLYTHPINDARERAGLPPVNSFWISGAGTLAALPAARASLVADTRLREVARNADAAGYAAGWRQIDAGPGADLLAALRAGQPVRLTLCGEHGARSWGPARPAGPRRWLQALRAPDTESSLDGL